MVLMAKRNTKDGKRRRRRRRAWLAGLALAFAGLIIAGCAWIYDRVGGNFRGEPDEMWSSLGPEARRLIERAFDGLQPERLVDLHVHVAGLGEGNSGIWINPDWLSWTHPFQRARTAVYMSGAGVEDREGADRKYIRRLVELIETFPEKGKFYLLAMDRYHRPDGSVDLDRTTFHVPNEYVMELARERPDIFVPVISVHPYRDDAVEELERWAAAGARHVKWLPNAMGIDPSSERAEPFYRAMRSHDMILQSHTGKELAVDAVDQDLGNPLLLRKPLDMGVRVVALHSASMGKSIDLESPRREEVPSFDLFLRLLEEPRYEGLFFGELSALTFYNHVPRPLTVLLERGSLHPRLVHGSDYPLPGVNIVTWTGQLRRLGFIDEKEREALDEIYGYNPLLFDLVLKRTVRHPETGARLTPEAFLLPPELE